MKKKTAFMFIGLSALVPIIISVATIGLSSKNTQAMKATGGPYELVLNGSNSPSELTDSYQDNIQTTVQTALGNDVDLNLVMAKRSSGNFATLAHRGMIYNFGDETGMIKGITSVTATFTGGLYLKTSGSEISDGNDNGELLSNSTKVLSSGTTFTLTSPAKYFALIANDSGATINNITFNYSCSNPGIGFNDLIGTYTGRNSNGYVYKFDFALDGSTQKATLSFLDNNENQTVYEGTASVNNNTLTTIVNGCTYVSQIQNNGHTLNFVSCSPDTISHVNFTRVYEVENFNSYSAAGKGWDQNNSQYATTGARSHWYADYYPGGSNTSPIGGTGWLLMGSPDYMQHNTSKGRNSSGVATFKGNSNSLRYIQMNAYYGIPSIIGKGTKLSFWAAGAYSDNGFSTKSGNSAVVKVYAFYDKELRVSNINHRTEKEFTIPANSGWTEYTLDLDPDKNYYSVGFFCKQSATTYTPIDDIRIYTTNPEDVFVAPVHPTSVTLNKNSLDLRVNRTAQLQATVAPENTTIKDLVWSSSNTSVATVNSTGFVTAVAPGSATISATTVDGNVAGNCALTVNPLNYPEGIFVGTAIVNGNELTLVISVGTSTNGKISVKVAGTDAKASSISYNASTHAVSIPTNGSYSAGIYSLPFGTITGTYDPNTDIITGISCSGSIKTYVDNNGNITASRPTYYNECDGTTADLQSQFKRRFDRGNGWEIDTSNSDRFISDTSNYISGTGALKPRAFGTGKVGVVLQKDIAIRNVLNIGFWVYNSSNSDINITLYIYKGADLSNNSQFATVKAAKSSWTFITCGFGNYVDENTTIYNFQFYLDNVSTSLVFDEIFFY